MAFTRNLWKSKGNTYNEGVKVAGRFTGGGAATNCTRVANTGGGITSVTYNAGTGLYRITFANVGFALQAVTISPLSDTRQLNITQRAINLTTKTVDFSVSDVATPTNVDLSTTEEVSIVALFSDSSNPLG
jgi:hypothetical protein